MIGLGTPLYHLPRIQDIIIQTARDPDQAHVFNVASQLYNNDFFMRSMVRVSPKPRSRPVS
jgi:hypothetical protein